MDSGQLCTLRQECLNRSVTLLDDGVTCSLRVELDFDQESMVQNLGRWHCELNERYGGGLHTKRAWTTLDYVDDTEPFVVRGRQEHQQVLQGCEWQSSTTLSICQC